MRTFALGTALLCAIAFDCPVALSGSAEELLTSGQSALDQKNYKAALEAFNKAIAADSPSSDAYYGRALAYEHLGDRAKAMQDFSQAIRLRPDDASLYVGRALAYWRAGDTDRAMVDISRAIRLDPKEPTAYVSRSGMYAARKDYDPAIVDATEAIRLDRGCAGAYNNRSFAYCEKGDYDRAIADANEAIRIAPRDALGYLNRCAAYGSKGDYPRAIADATRAIELDPKCVNAYSNRARFYGGLGKLNDAIQDLGRAIELDPKCAEYHVNLAIAYRRTGELDKALDQTDKAIRLIRSAPERAWAYWRRAGIRASMGQLDQAIQDLDTAIRLDPGNARIYLRRGGCFARRHEYDKAIADCDTAIGVNPHLPRCYEHRGAWWIECGDYDRGMADIQTAIQLNPADAAARYETWPKTALTKAAFQHGERQVRNMLRDRPVMARYGGQAGVLHDWATRKFGGEDLGRKIIWDPSEPSEADALSRICWNASETPQAAAATGPFPKDRLGAIMLSRTSRDGPEKGRELSFEELWSRAVFELYNVTGAKETSELARRAAENRLSKREFVNGMIESESRAAEKTRAFYIHVFLPWAKEHRVPTHPTTWFLAWRSDPKDNLLLGRYTETDPYWRHYERYYDGIVLDSLARKGEYRRALDLAEEMRKGAETPKKQATISNYRGYCLLRLNKPWAAVDAFSQALRDQCENFHAYLGRATAYRMLHDADRAIADYSAAIRLQPSNPEGYRLRGNAYRAIGDEERASADHAMARGLGEVRGAGRTRPGTRQAKGWVARSLARLRQLAV